VVASRILLVLSIAVLALIPLLRMVAVGISLLLVVAAALITWRPQVRWWRTAVFACLVIDVLATAAVVAKYSN